MRTTADILLGVAGQALTFDCPEGRPSSITSASCYRWSTSDTGSAEAAFGTPTIESVNTTLTTYAGSSEENPEAVTLTSVTGISPRREYLLASTQGHAETIEVEGIDGTTVYLTNPLANAYEAGDTFQSTRISIPFLDPWTADDQNLDASAGSNPTHRVRLVYVVSSRTHVRDLYFRFVRYASDHAVSPHDMESLVPGWLDRMSTDDRATQGKDLLTEAHRQVKIDLHTFNVAASSVANAEVIDELTRLKAIELRAYALAVTQANMVQAYQLAHQVYNDRLDKLVKLAKDVALRDSSGAGTKSGPPVIGISRR